MGKEIVSRTTLAKGVTACVVVAASLGIIQIGEYAVSSSEETAATTSATTGSASYTPGTYTATSAGISSDVSVTCTFDESSITAIEIDVSGETADIGAAIGDEMIEQFMAAQSSSVDGVSGATITSDALKAALDDCIAQATGGASDEGEAEEESEEAESAEATEAETEAATDAADEIETESESLSEADEAAEESSTEAGADGTADADTDSAASFTPGTYTASAAGISSDVTVTCTFDESGLIEVTADVSGETDGIGADIGDEMITRVLEAQSADVDGVSGATITSDAFKAAVADCMDQAGFTGNAAASEDSEDSEDVEMEQETEAEIAEEAETETESAMEAETEEAEGASAQTGSDQAGSSALYTPGTYTATAAGISSDVTVTITVDETSILSISCDVSGETENIGAAIGPEIIDQILDAQSADVDGVSGATITSDAVKTATADALSQAASDFTDPSEEDSDEIETEMAEAETEANTEAVEAETETAETEIDTEAAETEGDTEAIAESETEAAETEADTEAAAETEASETELTSSDEIETEYAASYVAGTYTATAEGYSTEITVTMTFDETSILEMDVDTSGETSTYALIDEDVIAQILEAQSADVDGISGATVTTDAILEAAADCIAQAQSDSSVTIIGEADDATEIFIAGKEEDEEDTAAVYVPGTYTASAEGISSTITVSVTFDEDSMYRIDYDLSGETDGIGADIGPELTSRILDAQSTDVDGVSGATVTSDAVKSAIADCIAQALSDAE